MTKNELTRLLLNLEHEHKNPIGIALAHPDWEELNKELHGIQRIDQVFLEFLVASKYMGVQVFLKEAGAPEFLFYDPKDVSK